MAVKSKYDITSSLYVGDLDSYITEAMLFEKFHHIGPILSIRVCRDKITQRSFGYAYINFKYSAHAQLALNSMNFELMRGRPMRIMRLQSDPSLRNSGAGNIFIKNLHREITSKELFDIFSTFGNILSCRVSTDQHGNSKGHAFVHFELEEAAINKVISKASGMIIRGQKISVEKFIPLSERLSDEVKQLTNVYIENLSDDFDDEKLKKVFGRFGKIVSAKVMSDETGHYRGCGLVSYEDIFSAEKAVQALNGIDINNSGKALYVGLAKKKNELQTEQLIEFSSRSQGINLYVKNLDDAIDDERLRREFAPYGTITSAKVMGDSLSGRSKGFGFVCFSSPEEATKAVTEMNGRTIVSKPLYVALAQRKAERKAHLALQFARRDMGLSLNNTLLTPSSGPGGYYGAAVLQPQQLLATGATADAQNLPSLRGTVAAAHCRRDSNTGPKLEPVNISFTDRPRRAPSDNEHLLNIQRNFGQPQEAAVPNMDRMIPSSGVLRSTEASSRKEASLVQDMLKAVRMFLNPNEPTITVANASRRKTERRIILGNFIYAYVVKKWPKFTSDITGILLNISNVELLRMLQQSSMVEFDRQAQNAFELVNAHNENIANEKIVEEFLKASGFSFTTAEKSTFEMSYTPYVPTGRKIA